MEKILFIIAVLFTLGYSTKVAVDSSSEGTAETALTGWAGACRPETLGVISFTAGDSIYWRGNSTLATSIDLSAKDGTAAAYVFVRGCKAATTNWPPLESDFASIADTSDMPHINHATYRLTWGDYHDVRGYYGYGEYSSIQTFGSACKIVNNVYRHNQASVSAEYVTTLGASCTMDSCIIIGDSSNGIISANYCKFFDCKFKVYGIIIPTAVMNVVEGCFFYGGKNAIYSTNDHNHVIKNNIFHNVDTVLWGSTDYGIIFKNNIIDSLCNVVYYLTSHQQNYIKGNLVDSTSGMVRYYNVDSTGYARDALLINADPLCNDLANWDDSLTTGSPALNVGMW